LEKSTSENMQTLTLKIRVFDPRNGLGLQGPGTPGWEPLVLMKTLTAKQLHASRM